MLDTLSLPAASGKKPTSLVMFLHGVGADGADLIDIGREWSALLPDTAFISPNAPFPCDMAPFGFQWFSLLDRNIDNITKGVIACAPILNEYIDAMLAKYELPPSRFAMVGFSQGTIMSLYTAPRRDKQIAGIVGYSGLLVGDKTLKAEKKTTPPILLIHGTMDDVLPYRAMGEAEKTLAAEGFNVKTLTCNNLGHGIDPTGLNAGGKFLQSLFA